MTMQRIINLTALITIVISGVCLAYLLLWGKEGTEAIIGFSIFALLFWKIILFRGYWGLTVGKQRISHVHVESNRNKR